jgi:hypothetical protein
MVANQSHNQTSPCIDLLCLSLVRNKKSKLIFNSESCSKIQRINFILRSFSKLCAIKIILILSYILYCISCWYYFISPFRRKMYLIQLFVDLVENLIFWRTQIEVQTSDTTRVCSRESTFYFLHIAAHGYVSICRP